MHIGRQLAIERGFALEAAILRLRLQSHGTPANSCPPYTSSGAGVTQCLQVLLPGQAWPCARRQPRCEQRVARRSTAARPQPCMRPAACDPPTDCHCVTACLKTRGGAAPKRTEQRVHAVHPRPPRRLGPSHSPLSRPPTHPPHPQADTVRQTVSDNKVVVYSKTTCPVSLRPRRAARQRSAAAPRLPAHSPPPQQAQRAPPHPSTPRFALPPRKTQYCSRVKGLLSDLKVPAKVIELDSMRESCNEQYGVGAQPGAGCLCAFACTALPTRWLCQCGQQCCACRPHTHTPAPTHALPQPTAPSGRTL